MGRRKGVGRKEKKGGKYERKREGKKQKKE